MNPQYLCLRPFNLFFTENIISECLYSIVKEHKLSSHPFVSHLGVWPQVGNCYVIIIAFNIWFPSSTDPRCLSTLEIHLGPQRKLHDHFMESAHSVADLGHSARTSGALSQVASPGQDV